jgi:hypothetical protein
MEIQVLEWVRLCAWLTALNALGVLRLRIARLYASIKKRVVRLAGRQRSRSAQAKPR